MGLNIYPVIDVCYFYISITLFAPVKILLAFSFMIFIFLKEDEFQNVNLAFDKQVCPCLIAYII